MNWEATDQFGNLYIGTSEATGLADLQPQIESLVEHLKIRAAGAPIIVTVDAEYGEINGPDPNQVSHVIRCEWIATMSDDEAQEVKFAIAAACTSLDVEATVELV